MTEKERSQNTDHVEAGRKLDAVVSTLAESLLKEREEKRMVGLRNIGPGNAQVNLVNDPRGKEILLTTAGTDNDNTVINGVTWETMKRGDNRVKKMGTLVRDDAVLIGSKYLPAPEDKEAFSCQTAPEIVMGYNISQFKVWCESIEHYFPFVRMLTYAKTMTKKPLQKMEVLRDYAFVFKSDTLPDNFFISDRHDLMNWAEDVGLEIPRGYQQNVSRLRAYMLKRAKEVDSGNIT